MRFLWDTFYRIMQSFGLVVLQTSPTTLSLTGHIQNLVHELRSRHIDMGLSLDTVLLAHENQPLVPLYVVNRGVPRPSDNQIRLRRAPVRPSATLGELATNRLQFAVPGLCMVPENGQNYLVLHFGKQVFSACHVFYPSLACSDATAKPHGLLIPAWSGGSPSSLPFTANLHYVFAPQSSRELASC